MESVESVIVSPEAAAARATPISPSSWASRWKAIGAMTTGSAWRRPRISTPVSTAETSTSTRGTSERRSKASRFLAG